ncbi:molybdopterin-dependent oxidoreductase [Desulfoferrobacter suflitae]|uniref:molybdopterin-dependent oxidoreductase n=1 Tax=Desulfoferrobacter suflitae TaxID=2865782 RepID=UPI0021648377|nr:molybdopterin-dependent oxidoreductase [Desulfoferrobacter suflitae]MCK8601009.1 molybdopterin-dependent oxidoreductase [Desulfoferrobacter suflitae]
MQRVTACTLECPDVCSLWVRRKPDGTPAIRGNPEHPFTRGFTCAKVHKFLERLRSPERITQPRVRKTNRWQTISWDEALNLCAENIQRFRCEPASILHIHGDGAKGVLQLVPQYFFAALGSSRVIGSLCDNAGIEACIQDFGSLETNDIEDILNAQVIVNWGKDLARSSVHVAALIRQARKKGTRVLTISPGGDGNGPFSDVMLTLRPGTDRFLAAAVIRLLMERDRIDPPVVERISNWSAFNRLMEAHPWQQLADRCGLSNENIEQVFSAYTRFDRVTTLMGWGLQRHTMGGENVRFINALAVLSGNVGRMGAGSYFNISSMRNFNTSWASIRTHRVRRDFLLPAIGKEILRTINPPVRMLWVNGSNVVNQAPESRLVAQAFQRVPFKVVVDAFPTDTAERADLILPCKLMLEREEIIGSFLHDYVHYARKIVEPPDGVRSDIEILTELGKRLDPAIHVPDTDTCFRMAIDSPFLDISLDTLRQEGFTRAKRPRIAYHDLQFDHPDGRYRLPQSLHPEPQAPQDFPLRLLTLIRKNATHSQILPENQKMPPCVWVSPDNPVLPTLRLDLPVFLASSLGRMQVRLKTIAGLHPQAVIYRRGDWMKYGGGANQLITAQTTDLGNGTAYYSQFVRLENACKDDL